MMRASENEPLSHPTQKPVALMKWILQLRWTPKDGAVLDPFMGSGTTLRAAKDLGRRAIGIEIEETYCEIASQAIEPGSNGALNRLLARSGMFLSIVWRYDPFTDRKMRLSTAWRVAKVMHL